MDQNDRTVDLREHVVLETRFGLHQLLFARWVDRNHAQVHDGQKLYAEIHFGISPLARSPRIRYTVTVLDTTKPAHSWRADATATTHTTRELAWKKMIRGAVNEYQRTHPNA